MKSKHLDFRNGIKPWDHRNVKIPLRMNEQSREILFSVVLSRITLEILLEIKSIVRGTPLIILSLRIESNRMTKAEI
jgi:hypothetical protein